MMWDRLRHDRHDANDDNGAEGSHGSSSPSFRDLDKPTQRRPRRSRPALEGFSPTPKMLEILAAQALLVASDIMLAARRITGERAYALGLAAELCSDEALFETALERARAMLKVAPLAQAAMRRLIRQGADGALSLSESFEQETLFRLYGTDDGQEGIAAFLEKRNSIFRGR
jgi:enoyl-CoA hydratase/carnithine racemase